VTAARPAPPLSLSRARLHNKVKCQQKRMLDAGSVRRIDNAELLPASRCGHARHFLRY
jgi:hypothetical protein